MKIVSNKPIDGNNVALAALELDSSDVRNWSRWLYALHGRIHSLQNLWEAASSIEYQARKGQAQAPATWQEMAERLRPKLGSATLMAIRDALALFKLESRFKELRRPADDNEARRISDAFAPEDANETF